MNKVVYSISGKDNTGIKKEIFKAGFDTDNKAKVVVGTKEVSIDEVISAPEGGTPGQVLTKTATATEWANPSSSVEANPTLSGGEADLTSIKIADAKYKVAATDEALTSAKATGGIGWTGSSAAIEYAWDGSEEGKTIVNFNSTGIQLTWCKVSDKVYTQSEFMSSTIFAKETIESTEEEAMPILTLYDTEQIFTIESSHTGTGTGWLATELGAAIIVTSSTAIITFEETPLTFSQGVWLAKFIISGSTGIANRFVTPASSVTHKIASSYISSGTEASGKVLAADGSGGVTWTTGGGGGGLPTPANAGDAMVYDGSAWTKQDGYAFSVPAESFSVTWDGNISGKETLIMGFCKISDTVPNSPFSWLGGEYTVYEEGTSTTYKIEHIGDISIEDPSGKGLYIVNDSDSIWICTQEAIIGGMQFTPGVWVSYELEDEENPQAVDYISKIRITDLDSTIYVPFNKKYLPITPNPNNPGTITHTLNTLKYDDTVYNVGTPVVANPPMVTLGTDLNFIKIGSTNYKISGGSGLPTAPTVDGGYALKCTVTGGTPTYTWQKWPSATGIMQIEGTTYRFDLGMDWDDWVNSAYNTDGFYVDSSTSYVCIDDDTRYKVTDGSDDVDSAYFIKYAEYYSLEEAPLVFYIDDEEYEYEEGMSWEDWINSEYNTNDYILKSYYGSGSYPARVVEASSSTTVTYYVKRREPRGSASYDYYLVNGTDTIDPNKVYVERLG